MNKKICVSVSRSLMMISYESIDYQIIKVGQVRNFLLI